MIYLLSLLRSGSCVANRSWKTIGAHQVHRNVFLNVEGTYGSNRSCDCSRSTSWENAATVIGNHLRVCWKTSFMFFCLLSCFEYDNMLAKPVNDGSECGFCFRWKYVRFFTNESTFQSALPMKRAKKTYGDLTETRSLCDWRMESFSSANLKPNSSNNCLVQWEATYKVIQKKIVKGLCGLAPRPVYSLLLCMSLSIRYFLSPFEFMSRTSGMKILKREGGRDYFWLAELFAFCDHHHLVRLAFWILLSFE